MLHFTPGEFADRRARLDAEIERRGLDALLLFAPESHFWLTGYDTFGYCFFQCLVVVPGSEPVLLTRSADLRQAQLTSTIEDIRVWKDGADAAPARDLSGLLADLGLRHARLGVEWDTHGLTAANGFALRDALDGAMLHDASGLVPGLRLTKSSAEIAYVRRAAELADDAFEAAWPLMVPGGDEAAIHATMQAAVLAGGGDLSGNPFIVGSGEHALLCRTTTGRRELDANDQLTLEWAGAYRHYHAALMRTVVVGEPRPEHRDMHAAARDALLACEERLRPGRRMGEVFAAHAEALDRAGYGHARLNACGYALGARFAPSWMEAQMFYEDAPAVLEPGQVYFLHMILMDSDTGAAMTLGRTSLVTEAEPESLSRLSLDLPVAPGA